MQIKFKRGNQWFSSMQGHKPQMSWIRHTVWSTTQANQEMNYLEWLSVEWIPLLRPNSPLHQTVRHLVIPQVVCIHSEKRGKMSLLVMFRKQWKDSCLSPFIPIHIKSWWGLFWAGTGPPYNFHGNLSSVLCHFTDKPTSLQTNRHRWKQYVLGQSHNVSN